MKKLLITGASGFLGWNLSQRAKTEWEVYGTYFSHEIEIDGVNLVKVDLRDIRVLKQIFAEIRPQVTIHTAALSNHNLCQNSPEESYSTNVTASVNIAELCAELVIPFIFTSTDLVFNGLNPPYRETDPVSPINYYGEHKAIAEQKLLQVYPNSLVCRMPLMFGAAPPTANSFIQPFIKALREGKEINLFTDEFRTPVSAATAVEGLLLSLEKAKGLLHLGGRERISRYQFGCLMAEILNLPKARISPCLQKDVKMPAPRSPDTSLDSSKAFALGYSPLSLKAELESLVPQL